MYLSLGNVHGSVAWLLLLEFRSTLCTKVCVIYHNEPVLILYTIFNIKNLPCFHTVIETQVDVLENEKLKFEFSQMGTQATKVFLFLL